MIKTGRGREGQVLGCELLANCLQEQKLTGFFFFSTLFRSTVFLVGLAYNGVSDYCSLVTKTKQQGRNQDFLIEG